MMAGIGFAMMAWRLAQLRAGGTDPGPPVPRCDVERTNRVIPNYFPVSSEYYRIIDNAQVGWYDGRPYVDL